MKDDSPIEEPALPEGGLGQAMLRAAADERPSPAAVDRTLAALGVVGASHAGSAASSSALAGTALLKWSLGGALTLVLVAGALYRPARPVPTTTPELVVAAPRVEVPPEAVIQAPLPAAEVAPLDPPVAAPATPSPPSARVAPAKAPPKSVSPSLSAELAALDAARTALDQGDARGCLTQLDAYDKTFPRGALRPEATLMRIEARMRSGDRTGARSLADAFLARDPASPYADRIRSLLTTTSNP